MLHINTLLLPFSNTVLIIVLCACSVGWKELLVTCSIDEIWKWTTLQIAIIYIPSKLLATSIDSRVFYSTIYATSMVSYLAGILVMHVQQILHARWSEIIQCHSHSYLKCFEMNGTGMD